MFDLEKTLGIKQMKTKARRAVARATGVPTTRGGRQKKLGKKVAQAAAKVTGESEGGWLSWLFGG